MNPSQTPAQPPAMPLRFGVLGGAKIARQFIRDVAPSTSVRVDAVASRNATTAADFAAATGVGRALSSYEALLADAAIDAIYLPLPNSLHAEWAIKAAEAGKHVLCEKPLALNADEAQAMFAAARRSRVLLVEALPYRFQPQTEALMALLAQGAIGEVVSAQASFGFMLANAGNNIRMNPALGGGALLDAGSYALNIIRLAMGCRPARVRADATWADTGVDISMSATLFYADGRRALLSCAMNAANHRLAMIVGSAGVIETEYLNHTAEDAETPHPFGYLPSAMRIRRGTANTIPFEPVRSAVGSGFRFAAEAFAARVAAGDLAWGEGYAAESVDNAATLAALGKSAKGGGVEVSVG